MTSATFSALSLPVLAIVVQTDNMHLSKMLIHLEPPKQFGCFLAIDSIKIKTTNILTLLEFDHGGEKHLRHCFQPDSENNKALMKSVWLGAENTSVTVINGEHGPAEA